MLIIFLLYVPKMYFSSANIEKLAESSHATFYFALLVCDVMITLHVKQVV